MAPNLYLAGPFFNKSQLDFIKDIEKVVLDSGYNLFSPRLASNAVRMNRMIADGGDPHIELREEVFNDNVDNIETSDVMIAVVDDFDTGTIFEWGFAYASGVPVISITQQDYGCNLMLSHSMIAHVKSLVELADVLKLGLCGFSSNATMDEFAAAVIKIKSKYKSLDALSEGPNERGLASRR